MRRIYNIALVGHVANGKTTLVRSLTQIDTKRSSEEKKSGRTIKLGYANCVLLHCEKCNKYDSGNTYFNCSNCNGKNEITNEISFVDAPGHHSYIHTMIKGVSSVEGAIIVTDVRKDPLQIQTREHLAILSVLGVTNVFIVQNKCDLVDSERCKIHFRELKESLIGTIAENSPIIPISAQSKINIDIVIKLLNEIILNVKSKELKYKSLFSILRSFDINKPGTEIDDLKGGVIGGTFIGNGDPLKIGDNLIIKPDVRGHVLKTKIVSIFSEGKNLNQVGYGGLFALGTNLDPYLTKNDNMCGFILCRDGDELPKPTTSMEFMVTYIKLNERDSIEKIKEKELYKLVIGSVICKAEAKRIEKGKYIFTFSKEICTPEKMCLIYTYESSKSQLIAFGKTEEEVKSEIVKLNQPNYEELLTNITQTVKINKKLQIPSIIKENKNMIWSNISDFCKEINREQEDVSKFIREESFLQVSMCVSGLRILKGNVLLKQGKLESLLKKFIKEFVMCKQCLGLDTTRLFCLSCGANVRDLREF